MAAKRFTDKSIAALRAKAERYEIWEGGGFGLRVSPHGVKSWIWMYRFQGVPRRMTLGTYPEMPLADAHIKLENARKLLANGTDPGMVEVEQHKAERAAETVGELIDSYLEKWAKPRKRSAGEDERILNKDVRPAWGRRKAKDITRRDVIALLDKIAEDRNAPIQANRTLAVARKMFNWAVERDIVPTSPCAVVKAPGKETRRDRVLSADEIKGLWAALGKADLRISKLIRLALKLQLATAQRKGEVISSEWNEYDIEGDKVWTIPAAKAKNGMAHRVPLSPLAIELLKEIKAAAPKAPKKRKRAAIGRDEEQRSPEPSCWLFPSPRRGKPIIGTAVDHAMRCNLDKLGITEATPHDLRRTAASHMTSIGISRLVVSKLLNHAERDVTSIYDRHSYDAEKRHALEVWGGRLEEIVAGRPAQPGNVYTLGAQRASA
jgi:integrase